MEQTWQQDPKADTDQWYLRIDGHDVYGHVSNYAGSDRYWWQVVRGDNRFYVSGIVVGRDAAMAKAVELLAVPLDDFNAIVAGNLREKLFEFEQQLLALQPDSHLLPGYHAGYEAGVAEVKRRIAAAIDGDPDTTESAATAAKGEAPPSADKVLTAATADGATL